MSAVCPSLEAEISLALRRLMGNVQPRCMQKPGKLIDPPGASSFSLINEKNNSILHKVVVVWVCMHVYMWGWVQCACLCVDQGYRPESGERAHSSTQMQTWMASWVFHWCSHSSVPAYLCRFSRLTKLLPLSSFVFSLTTPKRLQTR